MVMRSCIKALQVHYVDSVSCDTFYTFFAGVKMMVMVERCTDFHIIGGVVSTGQARHTVDGSRRNPKLYSGG